MPDPTIAQVFSSLGARLLALEVGQGRRTNPIVSYNFGALTKPGYGVVNLASPNLGILNTQEAPVSFDVEPAFEGRASDWSVLAAGKTPAPAAAFADASYKFKITSLFADGDTEQTILTINIKPNVATISNADNVANWYAAHSGLISGKAVEIAAGSQYEALSPTLIDWRPAAPTVLRSADVSRIARAKGWNFKGCVNLEIEDMEAGGDITGTNARFYIYAGADGTKSRVNARRLRVVSDKANIAADGGGTGPYAIRLNGAENCTFADCSALWVYGGVTSDINSINTGIVIDRFTVRNFADNAFIWGSAMGATDVTINDAVVLSPYRHPLNRAHCDVIQISDTAINSTVTINRLFFAQADGDAYCQGPIWQGGAVDGSVANTIIINGALNVGRAIHGVSPSTSKNWNVQHVTLWKTDSGEISQASDEDDGYQNTGPWLFVRNDPPKHSGSSVIGRSILYGQAITNGITNWSVASSVTAHNATRALPPVSTGFQTANPKTVLDAIDYSSLSSAQIVLAVKAALTPTAGGDYALGAGDYRGALDAAGNWQG